MSTHPRLGQLAYKLTRPVAQKINQWCGLIDPAGREAQELGQNLRHKLERGETVWLLGLGAGGHNAGASLVQVDPQEGVNIICNNEEERFSGRKHDADYPRLSLDNVRQQMSGLGLTPADLHAITLSWNYSELIAHSLKTYWEEFPHNWPLLIPQRRDTFLTDYQVIFEVLSAPRQLQKQWQLPHRPTFINLRHHDNHAYFSAAVSPFAHSPHPTLVSVIDGSGDDASYSIYLWHNGRLTQLYTNGSMFDSLGTFYSMMGSTQGGWTPLSSEGRYMGAAAWGNRDRASNAYYQQLRHIFHYQKEGQIWLNRQLANWHRGGYARPYTPALQQLLGPPIAPADFWNPDKLLRLEEAHAHHPEATQNHLDKAAATQMVFEDALLHILTFYLQKTGAFQLVLSGGTALNCVANQLVLEQFDERFYEQMGQPGRRLQLWVPPIPSDQGTVVGSAFHLALQNGAKPGRAWQHAFYCGTAATPAEVEAELTHYPELTAAEWGHIDHPAERAEIAQKMAQLVADNQIMGLFQGPAETGPRALGHRSFLANPCNPHIRQLLNERVKYRELIRPLAPMLTLAAAHQWFELSPGAAADNYNAYNYMVLTATARPEAYARIPAVIHQDGTGRLQIVRPEIDPLTYAYLQALGQVIGVEVSVNTSLNIGSPIVQTAGQALALLRKAAGVAGLLIVDSLGMAWWVEKKC